MCILCAIYDICLDKFFHPNHFSCTFKTNGQTSVINCWWLIILLGGCGNGEGHIRCFLGEKNHKMMNFPIPSEGYMFITVIILCQIMKSFKITFEIFSMCVIYCYITSKEPNSRPTLWSIRLKIIAFWNDMLESIITEEGTILDPAK